MSEQVKAKIRCKGIGRYSNTHKDKENINVYLIKINNTLLFIIYMQLTSIYKSSLFNFSFK